MSSWSYYSENRNYFLPMEQRMDAFREFVHRYEINPIYAEKLLKLDGYEIVFICDDSGSMNLPLNDVHGPYETAPTRWDELKQTVSIVVDLASILDPNGVDVYFLNREPMRNVRNSQELIPIFAMPPEGGTPIARILRQILRAKQKEIHERNLLILIATDGAPTNDQGREDSLTVKNILKYERHPINRIPVTIIACTDDEKAMDYLNNWDKEIERLDVVDDYKSEREQIRKCQGKNFPFSFGDYIVKILLGSIDETIDQWDEQRIVTNDYRF